MTLFRSACLLLFSPFIASAQFTDVINSNRPGESFSAFSVGKTVLQTELGFTGYEQSHDLLLTDSQGIQTELFVRYGAFLEQLEIIAEIQHLYEETESLTNSGIRRGFRNFGIGAKYLVYDPNKNYVDRKPNLLSWKANQRFKWRDLIPAVGVYAGLNIPMNKELNLPHQGASAKLMGITQNQFGKHVLVTNFYMDGFGSNYESFGYVVTLTRGLNSRWSVFLENQGIQSDHYGDLLFRGGAAFLPWENFQIDVSGGVNVKSTPSIYNVGVGISWRFDANYEEIYLRLPGEDSPDDKQKEKEKKKKKRKDDVDPEALTE